MRVFDLVPKFAHSVLRLFYINILRIIIKIYAYLVSVDSVILTKSFFLVPKFARAESFLNTFNIFIYSFTDSLVQSGRGFAGFLVPKFARFGTLFCAIWYPFLRDLVPRFVWFGTRNTLTWEPNANNIVLWARFWGIKKWMR